MKFRIISAAAAMLFSAAIITPSFAGSIDFFGNSAIYVNGNWYYCGNNTMTWCNGGAFNGGQLGTFTSTIELGAQSQVYEQDNNNPIDWNGGYVEMHYRVSQNGNEMFSNTLNLQYNGMRGNNNFFQSGGEPIVPGAISIATLVAGQYNLEVWFKVPGQEIWDSNNGANYVATFTKEGIAALANSDDVADALVASNGNPIDVQLNGLTLYKDGYWNTICLPFGLTQEEISASPLAGAEIQQLTESTLNDGTLTLNFTPVTSITDGTPYIIKWTGTSGLIENPTFNGVTIDNYVPGMMGGDFWFKGCFDSTPIQGQDYLYLGAENTLYYPESQVVIGAFHAYFEAATEEPLAIKNFVLNFGDETTGLKGISNPSNSSNISNAIYTLDGRRVNGQPTSGLYIINGAKVLIK